MDMEEAIQTMFDHSVKFAQSLYEDKDSDEIGEVIRSCQQAALRSESAVEIADLRGRIDGCLKILDYRNKLIEENTKREEAIEEAKWCWEERMHQTKLKAILNLTAARSYLGQLVIAALEEQDGLTIQQMRDMCDELAHISEEDLCALVTKLADEGFVSICEEESDRYWLLGLCEGDLKREDPYKWAAQVMGGFSSRTQQKFLELMMAKSEPLSELDWLELGQYVVGLDKFHKGRLPFSRLRGEMENLRVLVDNNVLSRTPVKGTECNLYYFTLFGEESAK